jgi:hypothetical protein
VAQIAVPTFDLCLKEIAVAEQRAGWLSACEEAGRFLLPSHELIAALSELLRSLGNGPVVEVCAGRGELAEALASEGVSIVATDADAPPDSPVLRASAEKALARYRPSVVLGCFVPFDAGADEVVMAFPSVRDYIVLGARIGGLFGSAALWRNPGWTAEPLNHISRWMLTRHDVWVGAPTQPILQHGEAWRFCRRGKREPI